METKTVQEKLDDALDRASELSAKADTAEGLTAAEQTEVTELVKTIPALKKSTEMRHLVGQLAAGGDGPAVGGSSGFLRLKSGAQQVAAKVAQDIASHGPGGVKALVSGGGSLAQVQIDTNVVTLDRPAGSVLDAVPVTVRGPLYKFARQTVRTNLAEVVPAGSQKPTSVYTVEIIDGSLAVVAHLSEGVDEYALEDVPTLGEFISSELSYGLVPALENLIVAALEADATGAQAFDTDTFTTSRSAVTQLQVLGSIPSVWLMNPSDWQDVELTQDGQERFYTSPAAPIDRALQRLWSVPVALTNAVDAGSAWLLGQSAVSLATDAKIMVKWQASGDDFEHNLVRARCEGRYAADVLRPWAAIAVDLSDES